MSNTLRLVFIEDTIQGARFYTKLGSCYAQVIGSTRAPVCKKLASRLKNSLLASEREYCVGYVIEGSGHEFTTPYVGSFIAIP